MQLLSIDDIVNTGSVIKADLKILFKKKEHLTFLDIGACTGEDSIIYSNLFPRAKVIAFEPLPENHEIMRMHVEKYNKQDCIQIVDTALSDEEGECTFFVSGGFPYSQEGLVNTTIFPKEWNKSSSLLKPAALLKKEFPWMEFRESIKVKTMRLDTYLQRNKVQKVDFIHMDVQGAEMKVLLGAGNYIKKVKAIWLEVENIEMYESQPLRDDIHKFMLSQNFYLAKDTSTGRSAGDCLYIQGFRKYSQYVLFKSFLLLGKAVEKLRSFMSFQRRSINDYQEYV